MATRRLFALVALLLSVFTASAQNDGITVTSTGVVVKAPDVVEIRLHVRGSGPVPSAAVAEKTRKRDELFKALKAEHPTIISVRSENDTIAYSESAQMYMIQGQTPNPDSTCEVIIRMPPNPDEVIKVMDTAMKNGAMLALGYVAQFQDSGSTVAYQLTDYEAAKDEATAAALANARRDAEKQAEMVGKTVGDILAMQMEAPASAVWLAAYGIAPDADGPPTSKNPKSVSITVVMSVRFELK